MKVYTNNLPASFLPRSEERPVGKPLVFDKRLTSAALSGTMKFAQIVPEQMISETVNIAEEAYPYIVCEIQSTIQHEAGHRTDEETRQKSKDKGEEVLDFRDFTSTNRAEGVAEKEEENCSPPQTFSGSVISVNLNSLFEEAKSKAQIPSGYIKDVKAGTLDPRAQGLYLMQDFPSELAIQRGNSPHTYTGFDGTLWVDVRKIVKPFIVEGQADSKQIHPSTFQDDGLQEDLPGVSQTVPSAGAVPASPSVPSVGAR